MSIDTPRVKRFDFIVVFDASSFLTHVDVNGFYTGKQVLKERERERRGCVSMQLGSMYVSGLKYLDVHVIGAEYLQSALPCSI